MDPYTIEEALIEIGLQQLRIARLESQNELYRRELAQLRLAQHEGNPGPEGVLPDVAATEGPDEPPG